MHFQRGGVGTDYILKIPRSNPELPVLLHTQLYINLAWTSRLLFNKFRLFSSISPDKTGIQIYFIFLFLSENIYCGYLLEAHEYVASNDYLKYLYPWINKKKISYLFGWKKCLWILWAMNFWVRVCSVFISKALTLVVLSPDIYCLCKQCRSRSVKKPTDLDLQCLPFSIWICMNNLEQESWSAEN